MHIDLKYHTTGLLTIKFLHLTSFKMSVPQSPAMFPVPSKHRYCIGQCHWRTVPSQQKVLWGSYSPQDPLVHITSHYSILWVDIDDSNMQNEA